MTVIALVPAFNEAERIVATVTAIESVTGIDRIIVIDDGSTDDTVACARQTGARVVELGTNRGKGAALDTGYALAQDADVIVLLDADLAESAAEAHALLQPIFAGQADMVIARFPRPTGKAGFGLVMGLARFGIRRLGGPFEALAPLSGQRALTAAAARICTPFAFGYGVEVAMTVRALRAGLRVVEVPTTMGHAATGRTLAGFRHRGRQFAHVLTAITRLALERPSADSGAQGRG